MPNRRPCSPALLAVMIVVSATFCATVVAGTATGPSPFHGDLAPTNRPVDVAWHGAGATRLAHPIAAVATSSPADEKLPPNWLVQVGFVARQDARPQDIQRIADLEKSLAGLDAKDSKRAKIERDLARERDSAEERRGFIVYGSRAAADAKGRPTEGGYAQCAFLLPGDAAIRKTLAETKPGDFLVVQTLGSKSVLSVSGRGWIEARRASAGRHEVDWGAAKAFAAFPQKPSPAPGNVAATLRFQNVKERESGEGYRYTLSFKADAPPTEKSRLVVWYAIRFRTSRGEIIGPVLDDFTIERGKDGSFAGSFGFDVGAPAGGTLDPGAAAAEVVAVMWE